MRERVFILPGRHQPPHNDHRTIIRAALAAIDRPLFLALITRDPCAGASGPGSALAEEALAHHTPERTPFSFAERLRFVRSMLSEKENARVHVVALPQP